MMDYDKKKNIAGKSAAALEKVDFDLKTRFGCIPKSIMKFSKDKALMELINWDNSEIGMIEGDAISRGGGYAKELRYSIYNPSQAKFILDYYTKEDDVILDPFAGRATRSLVSLYMKRKYIGFDTSLKTIELNKKLINEKFPENKHWRLIHDDGTEMNTLKKYSDKFDAVFTCPPYYDSEIYSGEQGDLSHLKYDEFDKRIELMFSNIYRLIKQSSYKERKFYPVIITVGTVRRGERGVFDMDHIFQTIARKQGFVLHDKLITENLAPGAAFTFRRNFAYRYVTKNYETTLVFMKY
jgi:DNA modification methylase